MSGDPLDPKAKAGELAQNIRKIKGLKPEIPGLDNFIDLTSWANKLNLMIDQAEKAGQ